MEEWTPTAVALIITTIGVVIEKVMSSYFTGRKLSMIEAHVNSQSTSYQGKIDALQNETKILREQAAENNKVAALLAQRVSTRVRETDVKENHLEDIKDNTADTVLAVKELKKEIK